jgi:hypothetical protein
MTQKNNMECLKVKFWHGYILKTRLMKLCIPRNEASVKIQKMKKLLK